MRTGRQQIPQTKNQRIATSVISGGNRPGYSKTCRKCGAVYVDDQLGLEEIYDCGAWARQQVVDLLPVADDFPVQAGELEFQGQRVLPIYAPVPLCGNCYVCRMVALMREVRRVLRDDGTLWLNLGDSYYGGKGKSSQAWSSGHLQRATLQKPHHHLTGSGETRVLDAPQPGLKPKNLMGVPWRVALALQADSWILRNELIWAKGVSFLADYAGSAMPESMKDRCSVSHETIFLFAKSPRYYFDQVAIQEDAMPESAIRYTRPFYTSANHLAGVYSPDGGSNTPGIKPFTGKRNLRTVWVINPSGSTLNHYAQYPEAIIEPMIKASTSLHGCCATCGAPYRRVVERSDSKHTAPSTTTYAEGSTANRLSLLRQTARKEHGEEYQQQVKTIGWEKTCFCAGEEVVPAIVLDPFVGSGTTLVVAERLRRSGIGIDLNPEYIALAEERLRQVQPPLFAFE